MEFFEEMILWVKVLFLCRILKMGFFENDDVIVLKMEIVFVFLNEMDMFGWIKVI